MMNIEEIRFLCLSLPHVTEDFPFDATTLVFRVGNKMFCLLDVDEGKSINLKCDPEYAIELRETYSGIIPGFHMNKKTWNTVVLQSDVPQELLKKLVQDSYQLIFNSLTKKLQHELSHG